MKIPVIVKRLGNSITFFFFFLLLAMFIVLKSRKHKEYLMKLE